MTRIESRRMLRAAMAAGLVAGGLMLAPASAAFAETAPDATCTVQTSELKWGVKTSFRNYISGSIANGEWTTDNGASWASTNLPAFTATWNGFPRAYRLVADRKNLMARLSRQRAVVVAGRQGATARPVRPIRPSHPRPTKAAMIQSFDQP